MVVSKEEMKSRLAKEEIDYRNEAAELTPADIPTLRTLINDPDKLLASKAAYLVSLFPDNAEESINALKDAAQSDSPEVRVAAAAGVRNIRSAADRSIRARGGTEPNKVDKLIDEVVDTLQADTDTGVQKEVRKLKSSRV
jgi:HEAT repeat protein